MQTETQSKKESLLSTKQLSGITKVKSSLTLDEFKKSQTEFTYYYQNDEETIPIKITTRLFTVRDAIQQGIQVVNQEFGFDIISDYQKFNLYAAKKTGKKKSDLPSLDYTQQIQKTKFESFVIIPRPGVIIRNEIKANTNDDIIIRKKNNSVQAKNESNPEYSAKHTSKKQTNSQYGHYMSNTQIIPKSRSRKETQPDSFIGCFCFRKKS